MLARSKSIGKVDISNLSNRKAFKRFGLKSQLKRASLSSMNNIAEGFARYNKKEFIQFLNYSQSSSAEVKSMLYVIEDLHYASAEELENLHKTIDSVRFLTLGFIKYLNNKEAKIKEGAV